jgi:hypothetical protein
MQIPILEAFDPLYPPLFGDRTHLLDAMEKIAVRFGEARDEARKLFTSLPSELRAAPAAWSKMDSDWCYYFGIPYTGFPGGTRVVGTPQFPKVSLLYATLQIVRDSLPESDRSKILLQFGQREKHNDFLQEFAPLLRLPGGAAIRYEIPGEKGTIEFAIEVPGRQPMLLEVKNRHKDLIHHLSHFTVNEAKGIPEEAIPPPDPAWLFKSIIHKFAPADFNQQAQGVWIHSNVAVVKTALHLHFDTLDPQRIHFAVLSAGNELAYVLARTKRIREFVHSYFSLTHHEHCVR